MILMHRRYKGTSHRGYTASHRVAGPYTCDGNHRKMALFNALCGKALRLKIKSCGMEVIICTINTDLK